MKEVIDTYALEYFGDDQFSSVKEYIMNNPFTPYSESLENFMDRLFPIAKAIHYTEENNESDTAICYDPEIDEGDFFYFIKFEVARWPKKLQLEFYKKYSVDITIRNNEYKEYVILRDKVEISEDRANLLKFDLDRVHMRSYVHLIRFDDSRDSCIFPELNGEAEFVLHL